MNKGNFNISKANGNYTFSFPDKKVFREIFNLIYKNKKKETNYYVSSYEGSNVYFGKEQWKKNKIQFKEGKTENSFIFNGNSIDFILNDKIDSVNIFCSTTENPSETNFDVFFQINKNKSLNITFSNYKIAIACLTILFEYELHLDFSKKYKRQTFYDFLKNKLFISFVGSGQLFVKTLKIKKGLNLKIGLKPENGQFKIFEICFSNNEWSFTEEKIEPKIEQKYKLKEKINYFYVNLFFIITALGILFITTKIKFNIAIFSIAALIIFWTFLFIYKKIKVIFGFMLANKKSKSL